MPPAPLGATRKDRIKSFFAEKTARRALACALFAAACLLAHELIVFFISWAAAETLLESSIRAQRKAVPSLKRRTAVYVAAWIILTAAFLALWFFGQAGLLAVRDAARELPAILSDLAKVPAVEKLLAWWPGKSPSQLAADHLGAGIAWASRLARGLLFVVIGVLVAVVHAAEKNDNFVKTKPDSAILPTMSRWGKYAMEGVVVMIRTQLLVSMVNAVLTLPILLLIGIPRAWTLTLVVFLAGMVPVLGNLFSGAVIALVAYTKMGLEGVIIITALTAGLHKIESYFINPRIASRHVHLSNTGIILSMLLWERVAGIPGLFISLPFLYLCQQVRAEWALEDSSEDAVASSTIDAPYLGAGPKDVL